MYSKRSCDPETVIACGLIIILFQGKLQDLAKTVEEVASELQQQLETLRNHLRTAAASIEDTESQPAPESPTNTSTPAIPLAQWLQLARSIKAILKVPNKPIRWRLFEISATILIGFFDRNSKDSKECQRKRCHNCKADQQ